MSEKYLIDTCIWRDLYEHRISKTGNPIGNYATDFFIKILTNQDKILFSQSLVKELKKDYKEKEVIDFLNLLYVNKILIKIEITPEEYAEARKLSHERNVSLVDCLNAILARNNNALLISRDEHFFKVLSDVARTIRPEQIN